MIRVAAYDPQRHAVTLAAPHNYGIMGGTWGAAKRRFFALNALEELDAPGEWYLDRKRKQLYYYPGDEPQSASIVLATLNQPLLKITDAKHVTFEGLAFEYGHSDGIVLQETQHVQIVGCVDCESGRWRRFGQRLTQHRAFLRPVQSWHQGDLTGWR